MSKFDSGRFSGTRGSKDEGYREVNGFPVKIHEGRQGKHIIGHNNYQEGKSILDRTIPEAQELVDRYAGTGEWKGLNREVVNFHQVIGLWISEGHSESLETAYGVIHYSKDGCHIVPKRPR